MTARTLNEREDLKRMNDELEPFYANAERGSEPCRIRGCDELRVRGITICPRHEQMFDDGEWGQGGMEAWRAFLDAMGGDEDHEMAEKADA